MATRTIEVVLGTDKDGWLDACANHRAELLKSIEAGRAWGVSPMTFKDDHYVCYLDYPESAEADEPAPAEAGEPLTWDDGAAEDEPDEDPEWAAWRAKAQRLDVNHIVCRTLEVLMGKDGTPLHHLIDAWREEPPPDLYRPCVAPHTLEAIGKYVVMRLSRTCAAEMALMED